MMSRAISQLMTSKLRPNRSPSHAAVGRGASKILLFFEIVDQDEFEGTVGVAARPYKSWYKSIASDDVMPTKMEDPTIKLKRIS